MHVPCINEYNNQMRFVNRLQLQCGKVVGASNWRINLQGNLCDSAFKIVYRLAVNTSSEYSSCNGYFARMQIHQAIVMRKFSESCVRYDFLPWLFIFQVIRISNQIRIDSL